MDDKELENNSQQSDAGQKTAHVAGKAAATYFGGKVGGQLYNAASNTKVGQEIEKAVGNNIQNTPLLNQASQKLNDSGVLDVADKGLNLANGSSNSSLVNNNFGEKSLENNNDISEVNNTSHTSTNSSFSGNNNESNSNELKNKKLIKNVIIGLIPSFIVLIAIIMGFASIFYPLEAAKKFVSGLWNDLVDFVTKDQHELEKEYYQELKNVQDKWKEDKGVCIDINLITASLNGAITFDDFIDVSQQEVIDADGNGQVMDYKKMKKQIKLLANMQIIGKNYGLNSNLKDNTGYYCIDSSKVEYSDYETFQLVDSETEDYFYDANSFFKENGLDSSSAELIARHDLSDFHKFFAKKSNEEKNYAYYLYHPPFDSDGKCTDNYAEGLLENISEDVYEISIGDYSTRKDSVYYWNLVNSFIPEYYKDYLPKADGIERTEKIHKIADEIYLLYEELGPSQTCTLAYNGPSSLCPNGITIDGVGTVDFEEYIAGVVSREAYTGEGIEALKAQAVAARTYALNYTDYCKKVIPNSTNAQTFTLNINDRARQAVSETAGEILINQSGKVFSAQYDSFCYDDSDCPDAKKNSDGTYSVTYTKVPDGEQHTIILSDSDQYGRITHGQGHAHGMSQLLSYQMAKEGKNYQEILAFFYSDSVELSLVISPSNTDGATIAQSDIGTILTNAGSSIDEMNQYIFSQVEKSGISTRNGVVTAASSLISGIYNKTGYKLPYELLPSGKYSGYGIDPNWGTNTGRTDYPLNGLDCSGFVSWAIHNGGFAYDVKSAKGWGDAGTKRSWSKGITDNTAQPGDLIYNAPASENGTTGHIRMIIEVTSDGYVVAEASGKNNGVRINTISFTSTGSYYLVNMTDYYNNATKVTDYP